MSGFNMEELLFNDENKYLYNANMRMPITVFLGLTRKVIDFKQRDSIIVKTINSRLYIFDTKLIPGTIYKSVVNKGQYKCITKANDTEYIMNPINRKKLALTVTSNPMDWFL